MIRELLIAALLVLGVGVAHAQDAPGEAPEAPADPAEASADPSESPAEPPEASADPSAPSGPPPPPPSFDLHVPDDRLRSYRTSLDQLTEHAIGRTSRRVRYDWRRDDVQLGINGGLPAELNNYDSLRGGVFARFPIQGHLVGLELSYIGVWGNVSADRLALTPYRQPGRPPRLEFDITYAYPLAEGIVTAVPSWFPATQLVFAAHADFRYLIYPQAYENLGLVNTLQALVAGSLSDREVGNLEDIRLPGMAIDRGRYHILGGLGMDLYFQGGIFIAHRLLLMLPLLATTTDTKLYFGLELDLSIGVSF